MLGRKIQFKDRPDNCGWFLRNICRNAGVENAMQRETLTYRADGLMMKSELFFEPGNGPRAGVLVYPEAYGLNTHALTRAERLASLGYAALACDLHGEALVVEDLGESIGMLKGLYADPSKTRARAMGGLRALAARPEVDASRIGTIGFCFGGTMSLELARSGADIKAVVGFHSGLATAAPKTDAKSIKARILVCIGGDDPFIPPEQRADFETEMRDAGVDWQMHLYGNTVHSFTNPTAANAKRPDALRYSAEADARSWKSMQQLFLEAFA
jgi:dienelactone hydrolase